MFRVFSAGAYKHKTNRSCNRCYKDYRQKKVSEKLKNMLSTFYLLHVAIVAMLYCCGLKIKFPVFQLYPWNFRCPLLIMNFHVFPNKSWNSEFSRARVRVRREGLVTRAEDRCCVECPSALIRCGGLNPTCRKPSGPEPLLSPHSAAPTFIVYRCSGHIVPYLLDR